MAVLGGITTLYGFLSLFCCDKCHRNKRDHFKSSTISPSLLEQRASEEERPRALSYVGVSTIRETNKYKKQSLIES